MKIHLPDVNVLIALHDPNHVHYTVANDWFEAEGQNCWATCPLTENGFVRIGAQSRIAKHQNIIAVTVEALKEMKKIYAATHHFWSDSVSVCDDTYFVHNEIMGPKQVTDIYLLALCHKYNGTLVTLDARITTAGIVSPSHDLLKIL